MCLGSGTGRAIDISSAITEALRKGSDVWNCCCSCCWSCLSIWQLSNGGLTAEKAEIVLNGNDAETFLSMGEPDEKPGGVRNPAGLFEPTVCNGTVQMKGRAMNTQIQTSEQLTTATHAGTGASEMGELAQYSFTAEEIAALFWRRRLVPKRWQRSHAACAPLGVPQVAGRNGQASTIRGVFQAVARAPRRTENNEDACPVSQVFCGNRCNYIY